jgi:hypothetical protein
MPTADSHTTHPLRYFGPADHVTHLVPEDHASRLRGHAPTGLGFFETNYGYRTYRQLDLDLPALVASTLKGEPFEQLRNKEFLRTLRATGYTESYYLEHKHAGLDYLAFGDWQQQYGRWIVDVLGWREKRVLDVGCACGAIACGLADAGALLAMPMLFVCGLLIHGPGATAPSGPRCAATGSTPGRNRWAASTASATQSWPAASF